VVTGSVAVARACWRTPARWPVGAGSPSVRLPGGPDPVPLRCRVEPPTQQPSTRVAGNLADRMVSSARPQFYALFGWAKSPGWADSCWSSRTAYSAIRTSSIFCQHLCHLADPSSRYSKNQQVLCRLEQAQPSQPFLGHPNRLQVVLLLLSARDLMANRW